MIIHSIKWRLQAWHGFLLVCLVTGLMTGFYVFERRAWLQAIDNNLQEAATPLLPRFAPPAGRIPERGPMDRRRRPPPPEEGGPRLPEGRPPDEPRGDRDAARPLPETGDVYFAAWGENGHQIAISSNAPAGLELPPAPASPQGRQLRTRGLNRELVQFVPAGRCILVGTSMQPALAELHRLGVALAVIGAAIVITGLAVGWWLATRALRPIADISQAAREIAEGDLSKRINASETESELGQLTAVLNSTFARLETAFAQQQQFTSDAAHELRTPVSVILTQIQSTLNKERSPAEYCETLEACQRAAQRMRRLIESLLELARFDAGAAQLKQLPFDLATVAGDCAELVQPLAHERGVMIFSELSAANCQGDPERVGQVITNLLTNAVNYSRNGGEVWIRAKANNGQVELCVADNGPGIPAEHLPKIFDRFYRVDAARTAAQGRTGLGLAICKAIVAAHSGSIVATNRSGGGAEFTVRLPESGGGGIGTRLPPVNP